MLYLLYAIYGVIYGAICYIWCIYAIYGVYWSFIPVEKATNQVSVNLCCTLTLQDLFYYYPHHWGCGASYFILAKTAN